MTVSMEPLPDGIASTSHLGESKYGYHAVDRIDRTELYTYVFIGKGMALILPHDRVAPDVADSFVAELSDVDRAVLWRRQSRTNTL